MLMSSRAPDIGFGPKFIAPLFIGAMLNPINSTMIATALVPIGHSLHAGASSTAWLVAGLYLASAIAQPIMGRIADRYGPRRVYLAGLVLVALAGICGLWIPSLSYLVGVRVLVGIGTSAAYPAALAMVRAQSARLDRPAPGSVLGTITLGSMVSAAIGPALGGLLVGLAGWQSIFVVNLPLATIGIVFALAWLPPDSVTKPANESAWHALDLRGILLFAASLGVLLLFLMHLRQPNWLLLGGFGLLAVVLSIVELRAGASSDRAAAPFLDLRMLARNRPLLLTYLRFGLLFIVVYGMLYGFTQWLQDARGFSSEVAGLLLLPMSVVAAASSAVGARGRRVRAPLWIGTAALLAGSLLLLRVNDTAGLPLLIGLGLLFGLPNGLNMVGNQAALYSQAPADQIGTAAGLSRTAQYLGAIFSSSLIGLYYGDRATDSGLHSLTWIFIVLAGILLVITVLDRNLMDRNPRGR